MMTNLSSLGLNSASPDHSLPRRNSTTHRPTLNTPPGDRADGTGRGWGGEVPLKRRRLGLGSTVAGRPTGPIRPLAGRADEASAVAAATAAAAVADASAAAAHAAAHAADAGVAALAALAALVAADTAASTKTRSSSRSSSTSAATSISRSDLPWRSNPAAAV
eukprot:scaffold10887_cov36-Phaeocystis_antarctica.AAC.1